MLFAVTDPGIPLAYIAAGVGAVFSAVGSAVAVLYRDSTRRADKSTEEWHAAYAEAMALVAAMRDNVATAAAVAEQGYAVMGKVLDSVTAEREAIAGLRTTLDTALDRLTTLYYQRGGGSDEKSGTPR